MDLQIGEIDSGTDSIEHLIPLLQRMKNVIMKLYPDKDGNSKALVSDKMTTI